MLRRYRDVFDPRTTSILLVSRQGFDPSQGPFRAGFLSRLDEREELRQRMADRLAERERKLLFLWYVVGLRPCDRARPVRVSRGHDGCLRILPANRSAKADPIRQMMWPSGDDWESLLDITPRWSFLLDHFANISNESADETAHCSYIVCRFCRSPPAFAYELAAGHTVPLLPPLSPSR